MKICKKLLKNIESIYHFKLDDNDPVSSIHNSFAINWTDLCLNFKLSERFIREFQDKVDWNFVSYNQVLSEDFILEFQDKINWRIIFNRQTLSDEFKRDFRNRINNENL
jgi:hypothetical protein